MATEGRIQQGFYKGRAVEGSEQFAHTAKGNEQIAIDIEIPSLGRTFTTFLTFSDAAAPYALDRLRACGWTGDDVSNLAGIGKNEIDVQIKYEVYDGKERMKVDIATGGGRVTLENQMDPQAKRAFAARMKAFIKNGSPPPATRTTSRQNSGAIDPGPPDDDSLPF